MPFFRVDRNSDVHLIEAATVFDSEKARHTEAKGRFPLRKISIGSDRTLFHLVLSTPPDQKSKKYFNSLL